MAKILFVDDERDILSALQRAVEIYGHQALLTTSGEQAVRIAREEMPDLIFIDMRLFDMSGTEVVSQLQSDDCTTSIPVIILSAGPEIDAAEKAYAAGALTYLQKPIRLQKLIEVINQYVSTGTNT